MCLVAFQKMFRKIVSDVWLCSWKYHRKHIFYLLLTFSWLPNEYIISFIPQNTNKTQKKIIKSGQTKARLWSARSRLKLRAIAIAIDAFARSRSKLRAIAKPIETSHDRAMRRSRSTLISALRNWRGAGAIVISSFFLPLSLSLFSIFQGQKSFEVKIETEIHFLRFGSEIRSTGNALQFDRIWSNNQTSHFPEMNFRNQFEVNSNTA